MLVTTDITIDTRPVKQFRSLVLDQAIHDHHRFKLVCPAEGIDGIDGALFNTSGTWMGADITIRITSTNTPDELIFSGIITQVEACRNSDYPGDIVISGGSPTLLLDSGPHCACWERKALKNIVLDVLQHVPANRLHPMIAPAYHETICYMVQYNESAWKFLARLAATYGEWLFYNGQQLIMGAPNEPLSELIVGTHLSRFKISMQTRPLDAQYSAYDYVNNRTYHSFPGKSVEGGAYTQHAEERSRRLFASFPQQWVNQFIRNKKQLDDVVHIRAAIENSMMVRCYGSSDLPCLYPGKAIHVSGKNVHSTKEEVLGDFVIAKVSHVCNGQGQYSNDFVAVPASVKAPPITSGSPPKCETQGAGVTDNHDEKGLGRIRVRFHWMKEHERSPWLRITLPHAGNGKGLFLMPEIGDEVLVAFEGDHPCRPYVIGCVYHGNATAGFSKGQNDIKVFQTRSGSKIEFNDQEGSLLLQDKDGNALKLNGVGALQLNSNQTLILRCGKALIELKEDGTILLKGKDLHIDSTGLVEVEGEKITLN